MCVGENSMNQLSFASTYLKVIPQYRIAHPYCAQYFASLARANERVHVQNVRNFPQARLDSEIKARFLLNEHGGLCFLLHNYSAHVILFNPKKFVKNLSEGKKDIVESVHKTVTLGCKL